MTRLADKPECSTGSSSSGAGRLPVATPACAGRETVQSPAEIYASPEQMVSAPARTSHYARGCASPGPTRPWRASLRPARSGPVSLLPVPDRGWTVVPRKLRSRSQVSHSHLTPTRALNTHTSDQRPRSPGAVAVGLRMLLQLVATAHDSGWCRSGPRPRQSALAEAAENSEDCSVAYRTPLLP